MVIMFGLVILFVLALLAFLDVHRIKHPPVNNHPFWYPFYLAVGKYTPEVEAKAREIFEEWGDLGAAFYLVQNDETFKFSGKVWDFKATKGDI